MPEPGYRTLYRIVLTDPPTVQDMMSYEALAIEPRTDDAETLRLVTGISLYNTLQQARNHAAGRPWQGNAFVAELRMPDEAPVTIERTTTSRGHHTLWGNPRAILEYVIRVWPVYSQKGDAQ